MILIPWTKIILWKIPRSVSTAVTEELESKPNLLTSCVSDRAILAID